MHTDLEDDFLVLLYDVARQMRTVTDRKTREHGSTWAQCIILARLERQPGMSQNELAAIAEVAPITVAPPSRPPGGARPARALHRSQGSSHLASAFGASRSAGPARPQALPRRGACTYDQGGQSRGLESDGRRPAQDEGESEQQPRRGGGVKATPAMRVRPLKGPRRHLSTPGVIERGVTYPGSRECGSDVAGDWLAGAAGFEPLQIGVRQNSPLGAGELEHAHLD